MQSCNTVVTQSCLWILFLVILSVSIGFVALVFVWLEFEGFRNLKKAGHISIFWRWFILGLRSQGLNGLRLCLRVLAHLSATAKVSIATLL